MKRNGPILFLASLTVLCFVSSCQDWGATDPPAGNQVYPKLVQIAEYTFDEGMPETFQPFASRSDLMPVVAEDADRESLVLQSDSGYVRLENPLNTVKVQNGVSITCWVKMPATPEGAEQDLTSALFAFVNENESQRMFLTANGWLKYDGADGYYEENNPATVKTGMMSAGEWHYLAMAVTNDGYFVYIDGLKKIDKTITNFEAWRIVQFMAGAKYLYLGYGSDTQQSGVSVDDLKIYRNTITSKETALVTTGGGDESVPFIKTVGSTDMSTAWWSAFSNYLSADGDCIFHVKFKNYTNGSANWNNWVLVVTNGIERGEDGYAEYFVLRADAYGWGTYYAGGNIAHTYDWTTFTEDMKGATVDLTLKRQGGRVEMKAITETVSGKTLEYSYFIEGVPYTTLGAFFTVEGGYLEFDKENMSVGSLYSTGAYRVGSTDFSTGWWSAFSNIVRTSGDFVVNYQFYNYTDQVANWDNWVLVVTNGLDRDETGYAEHFVLRADAYGWGTYYTGGNISSNYDWGTFTSDMNGAFVDLTLKLIGKKIEMTAVTTTTAGKILTYTYHYDDIPVGELGSFFTLEKAYIDFVSISTCPFINSKNAE
ncbi:MAG: LamG domain-containing protein [Dysgonamonadaceae bacterium]|jgi:hypothetical protein|nr:LamG domain-containing protein [Dysgonamonadaceae bacterium]